MLLKSTHVLAGIEKGELLDINEKRLQEAVNVILTLQNEDGGELSVESLQKIVFHECLKSCLSYFFFFIPKVGPPTKTPEALGGTNN